MFSFFQCHNFAQRTQPVKSTCKNCEGCAGLRVTTICSTMVCAGKNSATRAALTAVAFGGGSIHADLQICRWLTSLPPSPFLTSRTFQEKLYYTRRRWSETEQEGAKQSRSRNPHWQRSTFLVFHSIHPLSAFKTSVSHLLEGQGSSIG
jgi:hypothetical protein